MSNWQFIDATNKVAFRTNADGSMESCMVTSLPEGTDVLPYAEPPLTPEQQREQAKAARQIAVDAIKVTTAAGNTFDGDETSQTRMSRALAGMDDADTIKWILSDNTVVDVGRAELREALRLAGAAQAALWVMVWPE